MRWELDLAGDALYVHLSEGDVDHQHEMPDGVIVDLDADGNVVGIDVVGASHRFDWPAVADQFDLTPAQRTSLAALAATGFATVSTPQAITRFELLDA